MKLRKLLERVKELSLEVLVYGLHIFRKLEFQEILGLVKKVQTNEKKTIHFKMAKELFNKLNNE